LTLVLDASVAVAATVASSGFARLGDEDLVAPPLMWSEARSTLRLQAWHGVLSTDEAEVMRERLESAPVASRSPKRLGDQAWAVAEEMGWARTYDAEYVALARLLRCRLVTLDARLRRGGDRLGIVVSPTEL
jgi:predicted nucleic acid-binding protein